MKKYTTVEVVTLTSGLLKLNDDQARRRKRLIEVVDEKKGIYKILQPAQFKVGETFGYDGGEINRAMSVKFEGNPAAPPAPKKEAPTVSIEDIVKAISWLDPDDAEQWTTNGQPQVKALEAVLGQDISAGDRDAAWALYQEHIEIVEAIGLLDRDNPEQWTQDGEPDVKALEIVVERDLTEGQRDLAWALYSRING